MRNFLVFESQKLWFNIPGRENTMRNKSLIHTKTSRHRRARRCIWNII